MHAATWWLAQSEEPTGPSSGDEPSFWSDKVLEWTGQEWLADVVEGLFEPIVESLVIVVLALVASQLLRRFITKTVEEMKDPDTHQRVGLIKKRIRLGRLEEGVRPHTLRRVQRADALGALAKSVATAIVWVLAVFMILAAFGISLGPLIAGAGIVGVALGFGSQSLVKDLLSGVFMLVEDQYGVGDIIDSGEATGVVEGVGLRTTRIRSVDGTLWHVPNGEIRRVGNMSQQWARALLDVGVAYGTDVDLASDIIKQVADEMAAEEEYADKFLAEPEIWGVQNLGPDSVDIRLVIKTLPGEQWAISRQLRARIKRAFEAADVEIPFPQRTIWLRTDTTDEAPPKRQDASSDEGPTGSTKDAPTL